MRMTTHPIGTARAAVLPILAGLALAAGADTGDGASPAGEPSEGAALLAPFKQQLMGALMSGLARGPVEAVDTCHVQAPRIAADLGTEDLRVGRTSHRLRNPDNAGPAWATEVLQTYLDQPGDRTPRTVALADGRKGYVEPIVTQPMCLICHGSSVSPPVAEAIQARYPEDRATGFETGDLRGVFWLSWTPEDAGSP